MNNIAPAKIKWTDIVITVPVAGPFSAITNPVANEKKPALNIAREINNAFDIVDLSTIYSRFLKG